MNNSYKVLILDDDKNLGMLLREYLTTQCSCEVKTVCFEEDFWEIIQNESFDILFLDYRLQNTTGLKILEKMSNLGIHTPTVMMTGQGNEKIAVKAIQLGAIDYLIKGEYPLETLPNLIYKAVHIRKLQRSVQRSLNKIRYQATLLNNIRDAVVVWDLDGKITYWNKAAESLYGFTSKDMIGKNAARVYFSIFSPPISTSADLSEKRVVERRFSRTDKHSIWISSQVTPLLNPDKTKTVKLGYMDVTRDITDSKLEQEELIKSKLFIQHILDALPDTVYTINLLENKITYASSRDKGILREKNKDEREKNLDDLLTLIHPEDLDKVKQHYQDINQLQDGEIAVVEFRIRTRKQGLRWLMNREAVFSRRWDGTVVEIIGSSEDITSSKQMNEKLWWRLKNEEFIQAISANFLHNLNASSGETLLLEALKKATQYLQTEFGVVFLEKNSEFSQKYVYFREELLINQRPVFPGEFLFKTLPDLITRLQQGEIIYYPAREMPAETSASIFQEFQDKESGALVLIPMIYRNDLFGILVFGARESGIQWLKEYNYILRSFAQVYLKAMRQMESDRALRESEARYRAIVEDHQTEMICRFDENKILTFVNEMYCSYYGKDRSSLVGNHFLAAVPDNEREEIAAQIDSLDQHQPAKIIVHRINFPGEFPRWQEWSVRIILDQENRPSRFQAIGRDITDRILLEEKVSAAQIRLAEATRLTSIGQLASSVAHQISNPLTTIIADAQLLKKTVDGTGLASESIEAIIKSGWRAQEVINELMKFSGGFQETPRLVSLTECIYASNLLVEAHLQAEGITLTIDLPEEPLHIYGLPGKIKDLLVNLLLYARSPDPENAPKNILISARKNEEGEICVSVSDDGLPIPQSQRETLFEPQLIPTAFSRGTGFELSLCREIIRQLGGTISLSTSTLENTFIIIFPTRSKDEFL